MFYVVSTLVAFGLVSWLGLTGQAFAQSPPAEGGGNRRSEFASAPPSLKCARYFGCVPQDVRAAGAESRETSNVR